jgi:hypothetical protein
MNHDFLPDGQAVCLSSARNSIIAISCRIYRRVGRRLRGLSLGKYVAGGRRTARCSVGLLHWRTNWWRKLLFYSRLRWHWHWRWWSYHRFDCWFLILHRGLRRLRLLSWDELWFWFNRCVYNRFFWGSIMSIRSTRSVINRIRFCFYLIRLRNLGIISTRLPHCLRNEQPVDIIRCCVIVTANHFRCVNLKVVGYSCGA